MEIRYGLGSLGVRMEVGVREEGRVEVGMREFRDEE